MKMTVLVMGLLALVPAGVMAQSAEPKEEELREEIERARKTLDFFSRLRIGGYIQAQYVHDERSVDETTGPAGTRNLDQFSVRRGRIKFTYQAGPVSRFVLQPDLSSSGAALKDGYMELTEPWTAWRHTLTAGQFIWPFGFEVMYSSNDRELPEYSRMIRTLFPGEHDRGLMLSGIGFSGKMNYRLALVNGTGTTQPFDFNKRKDLVGRAGYSSGGFAFGASFYRGAELVSLGGLTPGREFDKQRTGVDFQWTTPLPGFRVRGESIRGVQPPAPGTPVSLARAADVAGWYFYAIQNVGTRHQFALRLDQYDPDTTLRGNATRTLGGAYTFHWDRNSKVMIAHEQPRLQVDDPPDDVWTIRYQYSF